MSQIPLTVSRIIVSICIFAAIQFAPRMGNAGTEDMDLTFATSGQNMWASGSAYQFEYNKFLGFNWNESGGFDAITNVTIPVPWAPDIHLGNYGLALNGSTSGRAGIDVGLSIDGGSVNVTYPVQVHLDYTSQVQPGGLFSLQSSYSVGNGAAMSTVFSNVTPKAEAIVDVAANLSAKGCIVGCVGGDILDLNVSYQKNLLDYITQLPTQPGDSKTYNLPNNYGTVQVTIPGDLNTIGILTPSNTLVSETGQFAGEFLDAEVNLLKLGELLPPPVGPAFIAFNAAEEGSTTFSFLGVDASISYNTIDVAAGVIARITQNFEFVPELYYNLLETDGSYFFPTPLPVGSNVSMIVPSGWTDDFQLTPVFYLYNSFTNDTDLGLDPAFSLSALYASAHVKIPIPYIADPTINQSIGPLFNDQWVADGLDLDIYSNTFSLDFAALLGDTFMVVVVPEPASLFLIGAGLIALAGYGRKKLS